MQSIHAQTITVESDQDWTADPEMISVVFSPDLLKVATDCFKLMRAAKADYVSGRWLTNYELYESAANLDAAELVGKSTVVGDDGVEYVSFKPSYILHDSEVKLHSDGVVEVVLKFKNSGHQIWFSFDNLSPIREIADSLAAS